MTLFQGLRLSTLMVILTVIAPSLASAELFCVPDPPSSGQVDAASWTGQCWLGKTSANSSDQHERRNWEFPAAHFVESGRRLLVRANASPNTLTTNEQENVQRQFAVQQLIAPLVSIFQRGQAAVRRSGDFANDQAQSVIQRLAGAVRPKPPLWSSGFDSLDRLLGVSPEAVAKAEADRRYWRYYQHVDMWDVTITDARAPVASAHPQIAQERLASRKLIGRSGWMRAIGSFVSLVRQRGRQLIEMAAQAVDSVTPQLLQMEFNLVESQLALPHFLASPRIAQADGGQTK